MDFKVFSSACTTAVIFLQLATQTLDDIFNPANIYLFKVSDGNTRIMSASCLKLTNKGSWMTSLKSIWCIIVNLNRFHNEQVNTGCEHRSKNYDSFTFNSTWHLNKIQPRLNNVDHLNKILIMTNFLVFIDLDLI